jgi:hypothetical protein
VHGPRLAAPLRAGRLDGGEGFGGGGRGGDPVVRAPPEGDALQVAVAWADQAA